MHADADFEQLYRDVIPSVVSLYVGRRAPGVGAGSGFVYDEHHVVTNEHVVGAVEEVELRFADGSWAVGEVVGTDAYTDLAVVAVDGLPESATPLPIAPENPLPGRPVAALGNPLGLDGSITAGIVSGANRSMPTSGGFSIPDVVQTDAPINPGNSGGPLVAVYVDEGAEGADPTQRYEVVGVNRAKQGDNIGFAVSPTILNQIVPTLIAVGRYPHSYLRARMLDVTPAVAEANGLDDPRGVLVVEVAEGPRDGDALRGCRDRRTVRGQRIPVGGDVVVGVGDEEVRSHEELMRYLITETHPGEPVDIEVIRDGNPETLTVVLDERPPVEGSDGYRVRRRGRRRRGEPDGGDGRGGVDIPVR
ncbi:S1C family serine protease [Halogeometricum luteum]|uniref:Trypsin-like peptidase domain-containing protein n=1 Tax=Halogeometricum luteum TaxID=2950537 RepID=A0ABU2FZ06_9EURY|nr:trypsin-like peptidase domain-containing protein [Halogeometricum sp. S3BR5-2]MDS0293244.1 trypsin-like peptidase domain-containing protein [Halogeometricum sp. S3BR5-2]